MIALLIFLPAAVLVGFVMSRIVVGIGREYVSGRVLRRGPPPIFQSITDPYIQGLLDQLYAYGGLKATGREERQGEED